MSGILPHILGDPCGCSQCTAKHPDTDRLAREFWERCYLSIMENVPTREEAAALEADAMLNEWRKRFDPPKDGTRDVEPALYDPNDTAPEGTIALKDRRWKRSAPPCDCWKHKQQVCDICQGVTGGEQDPAKETP